MFHFLFWFFGLYVALSLLELMSVAMLYDLMNELELYNHIY